MQEHRPNKNHLPSVRRIFNRQQIRIRSHAGRIVGLAVTCLTAVREVPGSNRAVGSCVHRTTTVIYSLGHGLCAPLLQCLCQLNLPPSMGR